LVLGVGAGGTGFDAEVFGRLPLTPGERAARLDDFVVLLDDLLREQHHTGGNAHFTAVGARTVPGCVQQPRLPLAIAAGGPRTMRTVAQRADAWITFGDPRDPAPSLESMAAAVSAQRVMLERACAEAGRQVPDRIFLAGSAAGRPLASRDTFARFHDWCVAEGFTDLVLHDPRPDDPAWDDDPAMLEWVARTYL
jgi:alkanesulfonate monooxygenase SsuD/methylene tetrahydromethanopterin reductase-like flavin-dependent oxidoreductase (luciferase family)